MKQKRKEEAIAANVMQHTETPFDGKGTQKQDQNMNMANMPQIQHEILKYMKENQPSTSINEASCISYNDFAGSNTNCYTFSKNYIDCGTWVIDIEAIIHVS